ncbi:MAG: hypothetical protein IPM52_05140 [Bacteroidetes bacterium]|nr:hypothetical protein [Bacteroidota bacterium]
MAFSRHPGEPGNKSAVHLSVTPPLVSGMFILSYERKLVEFDNGFASLGTHGGWVAANMGWAGALIAVAPLLAVGNGRRFAELSAGGGLHFPEDGGGVEPNPWLHVG